MAEPAGSGRPTRSAGAGERSSPIGRRGAVVGMGVLGALIVTVVGIAAGSGSPVATAPRPLPRATAQTLAPDPQETLRLRPVPPDTTLDLLLRMFIVLCLLGLIITVIVMAVRLFLGKGSGLIRRRVLEPDELEMLLTPLAVGIAVPRPSPIEEALAASRAALLDGADVRAAVIAAWLRLEDLAVEAGTPHRDTDTPTDLVLRLLHEQQVAAAPLERLADLYRRARFSPAELDERDRREALAVLTELRGALGGRSTRAPEQGTLVAPRRGSAEPGRWS